MFAVGRRVDKVYVWVEKGMKLNVVQGFFRGDRGVPPVGKNLVDSPPHPGLVPIFRPEPVPPPDICPPKFSKF